MGVLVCDDHDVLRRGLRTVLARAPGLVVVAEAAGADEALALASRLRPDVVLVGLGARGPVVQRLVGALSALGIRVVLLGEAGPASGDFVEALRAGARGYMYTTVSPERLIEGVRAVANGATVLDGAVTGELLHRLEGAGSGAALPSSSPLTARQWAVAELVAEGLSNAEIAERLQLSRATVKAHITVALRRLGLRDRTQLAIHVHHMTQGDYGSEESVGDRGQ
ncbi:LuxR C-terminal-related transcriptional regulator [Trujillonella endophytica]|uniref:LuxR C-terminal-related transcriptional regulator n=1 Tax=Trujillonella endophytica TaxID=673521 RepID=UPI001FCD1AE4|nr:response regulator transcription factor [Trujillella endophytica]